jgi:hypothetical protein
MPFSLTNAGATYQQMMQNCLGSQIGRNIQVYINDMVITTRKEESLISDLKETFDNLNRYKLKLNPTKCPFGVLAGQLLCRGNLETVAMGSLIEGARRWW